MKFQILLTATLLVLTGCVQQPVVQKEKVVKVVKKDTHATKKHYAPPPPKKNIELKKVEDENFSSEYMYPETKKKKKTVSAKTETAPVVASASMTKEECITLIGQEKFDRYAQMYGGESASLKKCKMLKAL